MQKYAEFMLIPKNGGHWVHIWIFSGSSRIQIRKKWLNQLKNFFSTHCKEYYFASFCWWIPSSCENLCNLLQDSSFANCLNRLWFYFKNTREIIPFLSRVLEPNLQPIYSGVVEGIDGRHIVGAAHPSPS